MDLLDYGTIFIFEVWFILVAKSKFNEINVEVKRLNNEAIQLKNIGDFVMKIGI